MRTGLAALFLTACVSVTPRFSPTVAATFAHDDMRKLTTPDAEIYYPASAHDAALRVAARLHQCTERLRSLTVDRADHGRVLVYLTSANFNNAYVAGMSDGEPIHTVLPLFTSSEVFNWYGFAPASTGDLACHEMFHYVHIEQTYGPWQYLNAVVGPVFTPHDFLERWFTEGVAQYYEGRIDADVGRPHRALYRALFESGIASRGGKVRASDLSTLQRELSPPSGAYLTSLFFVEHLADQYGPEKLWQLIDLQGRSWLPPFGVALRFRAIYGRSLGALVDEWSAQLEATHREHPRPADQRVVLPLVGDFARLATARDGSFAVASTGRDEVPMLRFYEPDGRLRAETYLNRLKPDREWVSAHPLSLSGLSFTADGRWLYAMNDDTTARGDDSAQLWKVDAQTAEVVKVWQEIGGMGGTVSPDGTRYVFVDTGLDSAMLAELDLRTGAKRSLQPKRSGVSQASPAFSPAGRLAYSQWNGAGWDLIVDEQVRVAGALNYQPRWVDEQHLVFAREIEGTLQAFELDLASGEFSQVTQAPFAAFDASPVPGATLFLNRDGWNWSLDRSPLIPTPLIPVSPPLIPSGVEGQAAPSGPDTSTEVQSDTSTEVQSDTSTEVQPDTSPFIPSGVEGEPAPSEPSRVPPNPIEIESDAPYSPTEDLFVPSLRVPLASFTPVCTNKGCLVLQRYSVVLSGQDRLARHTWGLEGNFEWPSRWFSASAVYINSQLAPFRAFVEGSYDNYISTTDADVPVRINRVSAQAGIARSIYAANVFFSAGGFWRGQSNGVRTRYFGPVAGFSYFAGDGTAYGGLRRAFGVSAEVAAYPRFLASDRDLLDVAVSFTLAFPPPFFARHSFVMGITGRAVEGAPDGSLLVGGGGHGYDLLPHPNVPPSMTLPTEHLPRSFGLYVRGFEDHGINANHAAVATARYRIPFPIDWGTASTFLIFPSFFIRQWELEAFGTVAATDNPFTSTLRAVGASTQFRMAFGGYLGLTLYYQFAARFDAGLSPLHMLGFAFE